MLTWSKQLEVQIGWCMNMSDNETCIIWAFTFGGIDQQPWWPRTLYFSQLKLGATSKAKEKAVVETMLCHRPKDNIHVVFLSKFWHGYQLYSLRIAFTMRLHLWVASRCWLSRKPVIRPCCSLASWISLWCFSPPLFFSLYLSCYVLREDDHTRVRVVERMGEEGPEYINASFIDVRITELVE